MMIHAGLSESAVLPALTPDRVGYALSQVPPLRSAPVVPSASYSLSGIEMQYGG